MKKLLAVTLFVVMSASAQTTKVEPGLLLTEVETLQISIMMKDVLIAEQQVKILQSQFQIMVALHRNRQQQVEAMIGRLRVAHKAPADKFDFDTATLKFVPVPKETEK